MPGAGTDKTKRWSVAPAPIVVLVEPQLGENIGAAARAMANFGLSRLRLVKPVQGWPNEKARVMAAGADRVLDGAQIYDSLADAIGDCTFVLAATARNHDQAKPVIGAAEAAAEMAPRVAAGENVAIVFGRERNGLENHEVAQADRILTLPVNPAFASLNLAQAVVIVGYEWFKQAGGELPFAMPEKSPPAAKQQLEAFFADLERELDKVEFFRPAEKRGTMGVNLRNIFQRMAADAAGRAHFARRHHGDRAGAQRSGARRRARRRRRREAARAARRTWRRPRAVRAHAVARPAAAVAPQSDRRRARAVAGAGQRPPLRRPRLQAAGADRPAYRRFRVVPAQMRDRSGAGGRRRCGGAFARRQAGVAGRARLPGDRGEGGRT